MLDGGAVDDGSEWVGLDDEFGWFGVVLGGGAMWSAPVYGRPMRHYTFPPWYVIGGLFSGSQDFFWTLLGGGLGVSL